MKTQQLTAQDVANYFITLVDAESGESLTHLKLQKLIYYAQGFHLALYDQPLFQEPIEAWAHGPVVPKLYHKYKGYGDNFLPHPANINLFYYSAKIKELLDEVHEVYGQYSAWKLRDMTHEEYPWKNSYNKENSVITHKDMKTFFKTLLIDNGSKSKIT